MTASEIRQHFLDFFQSKNHTIVPSAPIVLQHDPTLMFTNAGMNQFKDYFLGYKTPQSLRVADTQKCLRVSGKHNDLEEVGVDTYHHTMFEMLGNWSFGDYFKEEAIAWAWELLTGVYKIAPEDIYVTVFEGSESEGIGFDREAFDAWSRWIPEDRILKGNKKDNFWEMGETGPCGPSTEIHVDCRSESEKAAVAARELINADHPQVIEIWNIVFMQYNRLKDSRLTALPQKHVDTGMGFERLVRVLQGKQSNYDTDLFSGLITAVAQITHQKYDGGAGKDAIAFRVIVDHVRAVSFAIADGQLPSATGAGYVIRRILRRAVRYYYSYLGYHEPLLFQLVAPLAASFQTVFPELSRQQDFVQQVIREEELSFLKTLEKGLRRIDELMQQPGAEQIISGKDAFELYDTYGFPLDLTRLIAAEQGRTVDEAGFAVGMQQQKDRSRAATHLEAEDWVILQEPAGSEFVGYRELTVTTKISRYRKVTAKGKTRYQIVLEQTPFYAESGGQVGDKGILVFGEELIPVLDTRKGNELTIHVTDKIPADPKVTVVAKVNREAREDAARNHTATHLLHAALKEVLGPHASQKGSLVSPSALRFDFAHFQKTTEEELRAVVQRVNEKIRENIPVTTREMPRQEAKELGAMALFGEKYGDQVRVVTVDPEFSIELCGGTHVSRTGHIALFTIVSESAVAAGIRRIEALTGQAALDYLLQKDDQNKQIASALKTKDPLKAIERLKEEKTVLMQRLEHMENRQLVVIRQGLMQQDELMTIRTLKGQEFDINFIGAVVTVTQAAALKKLCLDLKNHLNDHVVVLGANIGGKAQLVISVSNTVVAATGLKAGEMIREVAALIGGGGGGQAELATAGGQNTGGLTAAIEHVKMKMQNTKA